jgi:uncharacterized membrane protein YgcG
MNRWQGVGAPARNRGAEPPTDSATMESSKMEMGARKTPETFGETWHRHRHRHRHRRDDRSTPSKRPPADPDDLDLCQERYHNAYKRACVKARRRGRRGSGGGKGRGGGGGGKGRGGGDGDGCRVRITF